MINCLLCGVGGQGIVLSSRLIAQSAISKGQNVRTSETIGMAQRGGCVVSHVRMGEEKIHSPLIAPGRADVIIGFEPAEAVRCFPYLKEGGLVIVSKKAIKPVSDSLWKNSYDQSEMLNYLKENAADVIIIDSDEIEKKYGARVLNISLLGAAAESGVLGFSPAELESTIKEKLPQKFVDINIKALYSGVEFYKRSKQDGK